MVWAGALRAAAISSAPPENVSAAGLQGEQLLKNQIHVPVHLNRFDLEHYTAFIAIDTEGEDENVREIGILLLSSESLFGPASSDISSLESFAKESYLETHNIQIRGRRPRADKHYERFEYGKSTVVDPTDIEQAVVKVLNDVCCSRGEPAGNMLLVGFQMDAELRWLTRYCPSTARFFSAFADLQDCCRKASGKMVGLQDSLKACGVKESWMRSGMRSHNAGNDTVRIMALLSRLVSLTQEGLASKMEAVAPSFSRTYILSRRHAITADVVSFPTRHYPFIVELATTDQSPLLPELGSASKVLRHYRDYQPTNARRELGPRMGKMNLSRAYICFASQESLGAFISCVNESCVGGKLLTAKRRLPPGTVEIDAPTKRAF